VSACAGLCWAVPVLGCACAGLRLCWAVPVLCWAVLGCAGPPLAYFRNRPAWKSVCVLLERFILCLPSFNGALCK